MSTTHIINSCPANGAVKHTRRPPKLPAAILRRTGLRVALLLGRPVTWRITSQLDPEAALCCAAATNSAQQVSWLVQRRWGLASRSKALNRAAESGHTASVQALLALDLDGAPKCPGLTVMPVMVRKCPRSGGGQPLAAEALKLFPRHPSADSGAAGLSSEEPMRYWLAVKPPAPIDCESAAATSEPAAAGPTPSTLAGAGAGAGTGASTGTQAGAEALRPGHGPTSAAELDEPVPATDPGIVDAQLAAIFLDHSRPPRTCIVTSNDGSHLEVAIDLEGDPRALQRAFVSALNAGHTETALYLAKLPAWYCIRTETARLGSGIARAARRGHTDTVLALAKLLRSRKDIRVRRQLQAAYQAAVVDGNLCLAKALAELPEVQPHGDTAQEGFDPGPEATSGASWFWMKYSGSLHAAAVRGHAHLVRFLVALPLPAGIVRSTWFSEAFNAAAKANRTEVCELLLELACEGASDGDPGLDVATHDNYAFRQAATNNDVALLARLVRMPLSAGVDPAACNQSALREAARQGRADAVRFLLSPQLAARGVDPGASDSLALAAGAGQLEVVRLLCADPRVHPGAHDQRALTQAAAHGHAAVVRLLVSLPPSAGVEPGANNGKALTAAARGGHVEVVRVLCMLPEDRGVDVGVMHNAALRAAAAAGEVEVVAMLATDFRHRLWQKPSEDEVREAMRSRDFWT